MNEMQMQSSSGLTMNQKHVVLAASSFALGGLLMWWWQRRQAVR